MDHKFSCEQGTLEVKWAIPAVGDDKVNNSNNTPFKVQMAKEKVDGVHHVYVVISMDGDNQTEIVVPDGLATFKKVVGFIPIVGNINTVITAAEGKWDEFASEAAGSFFDVVTMGTGSVGKVTGWQVAKTGFKQILKKSTEKITIEMLKNFGKNCIKDSIKKTSFKYLVGKIAKDMGAESVLRGGGEQTYLRSYGIPRYGGTHFINWSKNTYYEGIIIERYNCNKVKFQAHDGDTKILIEQELIPTNAAVEERIGTRVIAYWTEGDSCAYPGTISKISSSYYYINYDDGDEGWKQKTWVWPMAN